MARSSGDSEIDWDGIVELVVMWVAVLVVPLGSIWFGRVLYDWLFA